MARTPKAAQGKIPAIPAQYTHLGKGNFPPVFTFSKVGDVLEGFCQQVKSIPGKWKRKGEKKALENRIMYIAQKGTGEVFSVWESKALEDLFNTAQPGGGVFIRYDGPIVIKGRKEPMKGFTTGYQAGKKSKK